MFFERIMYAVSSIAVFSLLVSTVAFFLGKYSVAAFFIWPPLVLSGWALLGHLITLDDDAPGGWSNVDESKQFWHKSLMRVVIELMLFGFSVWLYSHTSGR